MFRPIFQRTPKLFAGMMFAALPAGALADQAAPQHGNGPGGAQKHSVIVVHDNDWSSDTQVSDCASGAASLQADDSWSLVLTNPTIMSVTATDGFCVGDYYAVHRNGAHMGNTPKPGAWGCDYSGTLSAGTFTKTVKAGTTTIKVFDLGFRGHSAAQITRQRMCPAGFNLSGTVTPVRPTGEKTSLQGWAATLGMWQQTLTPTGTNFSGESVQEKDPGGGGPDTCWFPGSAIAPFTAITGGTWTVASGNKWGIDFVGFGTTAVTYYRSKHRDPCGTTFHQQMTIRAAIDVAKGTGYVNYPALNLLGARIEQRKVSSIRAGITKSIVWP